MTKRLCLLPMEFLASLNSKRREDERTAFCSMKELPCWPLTKLLLSLKGKEPDEEPTGFAPAESPYSSPPPAISQSQGKDRDVHVRLPLLHSQGEQTSEMRSRSLLQLPTTKFVERATVNDTSVTYQEIKVVPYEKL